MVKVVIAWGGWTCTAGYTHWAYVAKHVKDQPVNTVIPGSEMIGVRLYEPAHRQEITDPKNCHFNDEPEPMPIPLCRQWIIDNSHELVTEVKMRTD